jgi:hypothetical protein
MTETPASEIPVDKIKVPKGFKVELWASGMPGARAMAQGDKGKIYIGTRTIGRVYEVTDTATSAPAASSSTSSRSPRASRMPTARCT